MIHPHRVGIALAILSTSVALGPLAAPGFIGSHDGLLAIARLFELERNLADGVLLPRWSPDAFFGYGYPFFNFYAPFAYQLGALFHRFGADLATAVELTFALGFLMSALGAYLLARCWLPPTGALVVAAAYVYFPYHLVDAHFRGDLSEFLAIAWFPWILWTLVRLRAPTWGRVVAFASVYAALIVSHNVLALLFSPVVLAFGALQAVMAAAVPVNGVMRIGRSKRSTLVVLLTFLGGVALAYSLSAFFWVPALGEKTTVQIERAINDPSVDFRNHFPPDLLARSLRQPYGRWEADGYHYAVQAGLVQVGLALLGLLAGLWRLARRRLPADAAVHLIVFVALAAVFWLLMEPVSTPIWVRLPLMVYVQFPWRLLAPFGLATAMLSGFLFSSTADHATPRRWALTLASCSAIIATSSWRLEPRFMALPADWATQVGQIRFEVASQAIGTTSLGEYLPDGVTIRPTTSPIAQAILLGEPIARLVPAPGSRVHVGPVEERADRITASLAGEGGTVVVRIPAWPGWQARLDGQPVAITPFGQLGLIAVAVPPGTHELVVSLGPTPLRLTASLLSLASLAVIGAGFIVQRIRQGTPAVDRRDREPDGTVAVTRVGWDATPARRSDLVLLGVAIVGTLALTAASGVWFGQAVRNPAGAQQPLDVTLGDAVDLLGYDLTIRGDRTIDLVLYWRARQPLMTDYHTFIHLTGVTGQVWAIADRIAGPADRPTSRWTPGAIVADRYEFRPPAGTPPGVYLIRLGLYRPDTLVRLPITRERLAGPTFPSNVITTDAFVLPRAAETITPSIRSTVRFENMVRLVGYTFAPPGAPVTPSSDPLHLRPGEALPVTLFWQALQPVLEDDTVFVHLLDAQQRVVAQQDNEPAAGAYPTSVWQPGEIIADPYVLHLPADLPPGRYTIEIGLYRKPDNRRLGVDDGAGHFLGDRVVLHTVVVEP